MAAACGQFLFGSQRIHVHQTDKPILVAHVAAQDAAAVEAGEQAEWFRQFEEVHPFRDGNGRTGQVLYNLLCGTLDKPDFAPDFWDDWRRKPGAGAPSDGGHIGGAAT